MHIDPDQLQTDIAALRNGAVDAGERVFSALTPAVRLEARRMLGDDDQDVDDVAQESLVAALGYLKRDKEFEGDLIRLAVTIARNRCRDLIRLRARRPQVEIEPLSTWLAAPDASALDQLAESQQQDLLRSALRSIGRECRRLLRALYVECKTPEQVRSEIGLATVQGVYHRRSVCLGQAKKLVQRHLRFGSWTESDPNEYIDRRSKEQGP